jgi:hypothetical protein
MTPMLPTGLCRNRVGCQTDSSAHMDECIFRVCPKLKYEATATYNSRRGVEPGSAAKKRARSRGRDNSLKVTSQVQNMVQSRPQQRH